MASANAHVNERVRAVKLAARIAQQVERGAGRGLDALRVFLTARIKEAVSVPAPRRRARDSMGNIYYVATMRAVPGAPIRKLSGRGRTSIWSEMSGELTAVIGANARGKPSRNYPRGYNYPRHHEVVDPAHPSSGQHPFVRPTIEKFRKEAQTILGDELRLR